MYKNPYEVLGISHGASESEIKNAYKTLAKKHHPDKGGTSEKFKEINEAYTQIMKGEDPMEAFPELNEIFKMFLNFGAIKGPVSRCQINLSLEELEKGGRYTINYKRNVPTGNYITCVTQTPFGVMNNIIPEEAEKTFEAIIEIPKCYDHRKPLIFSRLAKADNLPPGDLEVTVNLIKHPLFTKINGTLDLQIELDITLKEALTGFDREIKLLNEESKKIECRTIVNPYEIKRIPGYGMQFDSEICGDLLIKFKIQFPVILSTSTLQVIKDLDDL